MQAEFPHQPYAVKCCCCINMRIGIFLMSLFFLFQVVANFSSAKVSYLTGSNVMMIDVGIIIIQGYTFLVLVMAGCKDTYDNRQWTVRALLRSAIINALINLTCIAWLLYSPHTLANFKGMQEKDAVLASMKTEDIPRIMFFALSIWTLVTTAGALYFYKVCYKWANGPEAQEKKQFLR